MDNTLDYKIVKPSGPLSRFVDSFWMLHNSSGENKTAVILPDGRVDLFFSRSDREPFHVTLIGIGTRPEQTVIQSRTLTFAISFKLPAVEYILHDNISSLLDDAHNLPTDFWNFRDEDLNDFDLFRQKASEKIQSLLPPEMDSRKQKLFDLIYASNGSVTIKALSENVFWSSRQINRYFTRQFGLPLKAYCNILRFRASFQHIKEGKLFPEENFADQSHFIREIKKHAGVLPKDLNRNQNDRFIQFSTLD